MPQAVAALRTCALALCAGALVAATPLPPQPAGVPFPAVAWPEGPLPAGVDAAAVAAAADAVFAARAPDGTPDTRALLLVQGGRIVLERYADGFGPDSRFLSWSMAKSVTQALVALRVRAGALALDDPAPVPTWSDPADPRHAITLRVLLHMTSGLDNADGDEADDSFVGRLLFGDHRDVARFAADVPLVFPPGRHWAYSTGTSTIIAGIVSRSVGGGREGVARYVQGALCAPLGITTLVPEFDAAGNLLGGSHVWASARDWARLGLLYLRDGTWGDERLLPEGWVDFTRTPAPAENNGVYAAQFWLNGEPGPQQFQAFRPGIEAFMMSGNGGQYVAMFPDRDLLLVRLGEMNVLHWSDFAGLLSDLVEPFPRRAPAAAPTEAAP